MAGADATAIAILVKMNERAWSVLNASLADVTEEESRWRPHPDANSIAVIVRHLRIESQWHLDSLMRGDPMPGMRGGMAAEIAPDVQRTIDAVPLNFQQNAAELAALGARFVDALRGMAVDTLQERTTQAYGADVAAAAPHHLGYHQAMHLMSHCGQIRSIRNLYRKSRGERAPFFPENPTYPQSTRSEE